MTEPELEEALSRPASDDARAMAALKGDLLILGVSGKMGPSLAALARRASDEARVRRRVIGAARFTDVAARERLEQSGIETVVCDLLDRRAVLALPDCPNIVYMAGQKFGTSADPSLTWATNVHAADIAAERFAGSRFVMFSTGNVYPLTAVQGGGPRETDPTGPVGEYAQSALGRERMFAYWSWKNGSPMAILRLNYAVEPRYGVLRDIADAVKGGEVIDLAMGHVNVIWQRDANAIALRSFAHCPVPPFVLNLTGRATLSVRELAERFGAAFGITPRFTGRESDTALLSNAAKCAELFGEPSMDVDGMIALVAGFVTAGGRALGKPTQFGEREGRF